MNKHQTHVMLEEVIEVRGGDSVGLDEARADDHYGLDTAVPDAQHRQNVDTVAHPDLAHAGVRFPFDVAAAHQLVAQGLTPASTGGMGVSGASCMVRQ